MFKILTQSDPNDVRDEASTGACVLAALWAGLLTPAARAEPGPPDPYVRDDAELCARTVNALHQVALAHWHARGMRDDPAAVLARLDGQFVRTFCTPERVPSLLATLETT